MKRTLLITGGAGFIGNHVVRHFVNKYPDYRIINLDKLTYAGNLANLKDIEDRPNFKFVKMDICDFDAVYKLMQDERVDGIIHLAAESHVDRSIKDPFTFARTNVMGTLTMLEAARRFWQPFNYRLPVADSSAAGVSPSRSFCGKDDALAVADVKGLPGCVGSGIPKRSDQKDARSEPGNTIDQAGYDVRQIPYFS